MLRCRSVIPKARYVRYASDALQQTPKPRGRPRKRTSPTVKVQPNTLDPEVPILPTGDQQREAQALDTLVKSGIDLHARPCLQDERPKPPPGGLRLHESDNDGPAQMTLNFPRLLVAQADSKHHDLASFLEHVARTGVNVDSSVYRGTHFEYVTAQTLIAYGFELHRIGRSNDLGIDLIGTWTLPTFPSELKVIVQCKVTQPSPSMIRELEGAYAGAPAGWQLNDTMALLVSMKPATKGVRDALQRSKLPMGVAQITSMGVLSQFLWNHVVAETRLTGLGTAVAHAPVSRSYDGQRCGSNKPCVALTWLGDLWRSP